MNAAHRLAILCVTGLALGGCDSRPAKDQATTAARVLEVQRDEAGYEQCVSHPDPAGYHWPREAVEAFCADQFTDAVAFSDVRRMIEAGQGRELDAEYDALLADYFAGQLPEGALRQAYAVFPVSDESSAALLDRWLMQSTGSAHARAARGIYRVDRGWKARGFEVIKQTSRDELESMVHWIQLAKPDLEKAIEIEPRIVAAYDALIQIAFMARGIASIEPTIAAANKVDPANFYARAAYAISLQPRWGGSLASLDDLAAESEGWLGRNPRVAALRASALVARAEDSLKAGKLAVALEEIERGLALCPIPHDMDLAGRLAHQLKDLPRAIEFFSQTLRFKPDDDEARVHRAQTLAAMNKLPAAKSDLDYVLKREPDSLDALVAYTLLLIDEGDIPGAIVKLEAAHRAHPKDAWTLGKLAWVYLYKANSPQQAEPLVSKFIEVAPKSGGGWLMRADILDDLGKPGVREAAENFVRYVNTSDEWQRNALPRVKSWLAEHPAG